MNNRFALCLLVLGCVALGLPRQARPQFLGSTSSSENEEFAPKIVGYNAIERRGEGGKLLRLYVQLRRSEDDYAPPNFKPKKGLFRVVATLGDATVVDVGTFGGSGSKSDGVSLLLMFDVSGSMVRFWDVIGEECIHLIEEMRAGDEMGIAFFGGGWVFSGLKGREGAAELKAWVKVQLPESVFEWSRKLRGLATINLPYRIVCDLHWTCDATQSWKRRLLPSTRRSVDCSTNERGVCGRQQSLAP